MSDITFDGNAHTITLFNKSGKVVGAWPANNRTESHATLRFVQDGTYLVTDSRVPNHHSAKEDSVNGKYGTFGIVRFIVYGHDGIGIHAGRKDVPDLTPEQGRGPDHVTEGCIRTVEAAMQAITHTMQNDPLIHVKVQNNHNQRK